VRLNKVNLKKEFPRYWWRWDFKIIRCDREKNKWYTL